MSDQPAGDEELPAPGEPEPKSSKAGRDLPMAIGAGVVLGLAALLTLIFVKWIFTVLAVVAVWLGTVELATRLRGVGYRVTLPVILIALPIMTFVAYNYGPVGHL